MDKGGIRSGAMLQSSIDKDRPGGESARSWLGNWVILLETWELKGRWEDLLFTP